MHLFDACPNGHTCSGCLGFDHLFEAVELVALQSIQIKQQKTPEKSLKRQVLRADYRERVSVGLAIAWGM